MKLSTLLFTIGLFALCDAHSRGASVRDSIEMVRLAGARLTPDPTRVWPSPDRRRFAIVTFRGDLTKGVNEFDLLVYDSEEVREFANASRDASLPKPRKLARFETDKRWYMDNGIDQIRWSADGRRIIFIGRQAGRLDGVYSVDVETGQLQELVTTPDPDVRGISRYDISPDGSSFVLGSAAAQDLTERNRRGYVVDAAFQLSTPDVKRGLERLTYYLADARDGRITILPIPPRYEAARPAFYSPSGRWAIIAPSVTPPREWLAYAAVSNVLKASGARNDSSLDLEATFAHGNIRQLMLIDTRSGAVRPLVDAPAYAFFDTVPLWREDERKVIVGPTYLPVTRSSNEDRTRTQAIAEIELETGRSEWIMDVQTPPQSSYPPQVRLTDLAGGIVKIEIGNAEKPLVANGFRRVQRKWQSVPLPDQAATQENRAVSISITEGLDSPPELLARDPATGRQRVITDLNPQLRGMRMGKVENLTWTDSEGRSQAGVLAYPPDFVGGKRYPLVVQINHGQARKENSFFFNGSRDDWSFSGFAARAIAARDMMVLELQLSIDYSDSVVTEENWHTASELGQFLLALESAVEELDKRNLVDTGRIGVAGYSRGGMLAEYAMTFSKIPIAAAVVIDSVASSPGSYADFYPSMQDWERSGHMGAPFWGQGRELWYRRSPLFNLECNRAATRFYVLGTRGYTPQWEFYALMRRMRMPAEVIHVPGAAHVLTTPHARYTVQEGNVDWFDFWINGREDAEPEKKAQYEGWRRMRGEAEAAAEAHASERMRNPRCNK